MVKVSDIYNVIDSIAPFSLQEGWDNSGLLAGSPDAEVRRVLTALDITCEVIREAQQKKAQLIVSHHPVIFAPLKCVMSDSPAGMLLSSGISAICTHTPFDMSPAGMNKGLFDILKEPLGLCAEGIPLLDEGNGNSIGRVYELSLPLLPAEAAARLKRALGCVCVRYTPSGRLIRRMAISSGAGNSIAPLAASLKADALVSGDFKHDVLVDIGINGGLCLIDCGHFYTERIFAEMMRDILTGAFSKIEVQRAECCTDPVNYCFTD